MIRPLKVIANALTRGFHLIAHRGLPWPAVSAVNKLHLSSGLPTLLIWGDQDRIIPVAHGYAAHDALPDSRLEVLPGVGHFPHVESPTAVVDILDDFIATTGPHADLANRERDQDRGAASADV